MNKVKHVNLLKLARMKKRAREAQRRFKAVRWFHGARYMIRPGAGDCLRVYECQKSGGIPYLEHLTSLGLGRLGLADVTLRPAEELFTDTTECWIAACSASNERCSLGAPAYLIESMAACLIDRLLERIDRLPIEGGARLQDTINTALQAVQAVKPSSLISLFESSDEELAAIIGSLRAEFSPA